MVFAETEQVACHDGSGRLAEASVVVRRPTLELPSKLRDQLVESMDSFFNALGSSPEPEAVVNYTIELLEEYGDEAGIEDIVLTLEEAGSLDSSLASLLEDEVGSNAEFEATGEEVVSLLERVCGVEFIGRGDIIADEDDDDDEDDF